MDDIGDDSRSALEEFKASFFASLGPQVREAKATIRELNPAGAALDALTKDNPLLGVILSRLNLPEAVSGLQAPTDNAKEPTKNPFTLGKQG